MFDKHSYTRKGDAANIVRDKASETWGFAYEIGDSEDQDRLAQREGGYHKITCVATMHDGPELECLTYVADKRCTRGCGAPASYLDLIVSGGLERGLPPAYLDYVREAATGRK